MKRNFNSLNSGNSNINSNNRNTNNLIANNQRTTNADFQANYNSNSHLNNKNISTANRNNSINKFTNNSTSNISNANNKQRTSNTSAGIKNLNNPKTFTKPSSNFSSGTIVSNQIFQNFNNQEYLNLDSFNYYGNGPQNQANSIPNTNNPNFNNNYNAKNDNSQNQGFALAKQHDNSIEHFSGNIQPREGLKKPTTSFNIQPQKSFLDNFSGNKSSPNENTKGRKHFANDAIFKDNSNNNTNFNSNDKFANKNNKLASLSNSNVNLNPSDNNNNTKLIINLGKNVNNNNINVNSRGIINKNNNNNNNNISNANQKNFVANTQSSKSILLKIKSAKTSGIINISNMNLNSLPREIFDDTVRFEDINWWELVDIKKIDATNNQIDETFNNENISFEQIPNLNYLKFSGNNFTCIPDSINSLYNLKFLDFSDNKIRSIPESIRGLKSLVELNLSNNAISAIPNELGKLTELEILNISQNKISVIPQGCANLAKLKRLNLSNNFFDFIPAFFANFSMLEELMLFKNKIKDIYDNALVPLYNLKYLDLHNNSLEAFKEIPNSPKLDSLILGYNRIEALENLQNSPNLTVLDLNNNKLEYFPEQILNLKNLITLNLQNNSINDIPPQLCYLNKLTRLNIEGNPLKKLNSKIRSANAEQIKSYLKTRIVDDIGDLSLNMVNNNINEKFDNANNNYNYNNSNAANLPCNINTISSNNISNQQKELNLNLLLNKEANINLLSYYQNNYLKVINLDIENIPVENFKKLKIFNCVGLDLSNNKIKDLNFFESLPDFKDLHELKVNFNKLTSINPKIINFNNLKTLELRNNNLSDFLEDFDFNSLHNNSSLFSSNNINSKNKNAKSLPNNTNNSKINNKDLKNNNNKNNILAIEENCDFGNNSEIFQSLEYLDLSFNKFKLIPSFVQYCPKLTSLLLSNNCIENAEFLKMLNNKNLYTLDLGTNKITCLPDLLYKNIPNLKIFQIENNEVKNIPTDLCFMINLNKLSLSGNPLKQIRSNIINGGTKSILEYLRKMHRFTDEEIEIENKKSSNFLNFGTDSVAEGQNKFNKKSYKNAESVPMDIDTDNNNNFNNRNNIKNSISHNNANSEPPLNRNPEPFQADQKIASDSTYPKANSNAMDIVDQQPDHDKVPSSVIDEDIEKINREIIQIEETLNDRNLTAYVRAQTKKEFFSLIRKRADLLTKIGDKSTI